MTLKVGQKAPNFTIATENEDFTLSDHRGKKIVIYFYPKDMTPGCTVQANEFTYLHDEFKKLNTLIIGISKDTNEKHAKFRAKYDLTIQLGSDTEGVVLDTYKAWGNKMLYGRTFLGIIRSTYLIDENGLIQKIWPKVKTKGHAKSVLDTVKEFR